MADFDPTRDIPDLTGKTIVVTGGNAGLGAATIRAVAAHRPANLFLCARTVSKADAVIEQLRKDLPDTTTKAIQLDLASFESIKDAAKQINDSCRMIDVLFLNAGVSGLAPGLTKDGYEIQFGTNHVGHVLFTQLLMPKILAAAKEPGHKPRIVVVASAAAHQYKAKEGIVFDELKQNMAGRNSIVRYGHSKLANILFTKALAKQYPSVTTVSVHPGVVWTEIWDKSDQVPWLTPIVSGVIRLLGNNVDKGVKNQLWAGFAEGVQSGAYYHPVGRIEASSAAANDPELRDKLWQWTNDELSEHGSPGWPAVEAV